jgi:PKD repeat protein
VVRKMVVARILVLVALSVGSLMLASCDWLVPQPRVDFTFDPASGEEPLVVEFAAVLEDAATSHLWTFGDGATSTESAPSHIYYAAGTYSVTLVVTFEDGVPVSRTKADCIVVSAGPMFRESDGLYWLDEDLGSITRGTRDGLGAQESVIGGLRNASTMAVNSSHVFWGTSSAVWRLPLDHSTGSQSIASNQKPIVDLAVDTRLNKVYWTVTPSLPIMTDQYDGGIYRANFDGTSRETFKSYPASSNWFATEVAVDPFGGFVYWFYAKSDYVGPLGASGAMAMDWEGEIQASPVFGMATTTIYPLSEGTRLAVSSGLPHIAQYLYWTDSVAGKIWVGKIDGSEMRQLLTGLPHPKGIAIETSDNALFWSDDDGIHRANLDGTNARLLYDVSADVLDVGP